MTEGLGGSQERVGEEIEKAPGNKWLLVRSGNGGQEAHQGDLPQEWIGNGIILCGDDDGKWVTFMNDGNYKKTNSPVETDAESFWAAIKRHRKQVSEI